MLVWLTQPRTAHLAFTEPGPRGNTPTLVPLQNAGAERAGSGGNLCTGIRKITLPPCTQLSQRALSAAQRALFSISGERTGEIAEVRDEAAIPAASES